MKNIFKIILLVLIFVMNAEAQQVTWQKWYDYKHGDESGWDALQTYDGGYAILSRAIFGNDSIILTKLNYLGNIEWQKAFGDSLGNPIPRSLQQTSDSRFILAGGVGSVRGFISRFDKSGMLLWKKYYKKNNLDTRFFDCKITSDGGFIACGDLWPPIKGYIVKTDFLGNVQWDSVYSKVSQKIIQSSDNNYYYSNVLSLTKINSIGKIIWTVDYSLKSGPYLIESPSGSIFSSGGVDSINLSKFDSSGNLLWHKSFYNGATSFSMCLGKDKNLILLGTKDTLIQLDFIAVKVNLNGDQIFKRKINTVQGNWYKIPSSIRATDDYGYIMSGWTDYPGFPFNDNLLVVKTDSTCFAPKIVGINNLQTTVLDNFYLYQNYPNPFNPQTNIPFDVKKRSKVLLKLFDITGKEIMILFNNYLEAGKYEINFNINKMNLSSGIYFYSLVTEKNIISKRMTIIK